MSRLRLLVKLGELLSMPLESNFKEVRIAENERLCRSRFENIAMRKRLNAVHMPRKNNAGEWKLSAGKPNIKQKKSDGRKRHLNAICPLRGTILTIINLIGFIINVPKNLPSAV